MISASSFAPANVSCIFGIRQHRNPRKMGSVGVGFCLNEGVAVKAMRDKKTSVRLNTRQIDLPTVNTVIESLTNRTARIEIESNLPLSCGFGLSGASALATAYSVNKLFDLKKSKLDLAIAAHTAEVINGTGLGDVVNQYYGGFCVKLESSANFVVKRLPIAGRSVYCKYFGPIETSSVIQDNYIRGVINDAADKALQKIKTMIRDPKRIGDFSGIIRISGQFAAESGLLQDEKVINLINKIEKNGGNASMIMLGNALFSDIPFTGCRECRISNKAALLH